VREAAGAKLIYTTLLTLAVKTFDLVAIDPSVRREEFWLQGAIAADANRILLATRDGEFFRVGLDAEAPSVHRLPLKLDLNQGELLTTAAEVVNREHVLVRILEVLILKSGLLAVSYTRWNPEQECVTLLVGITELPNDWDEARNSWRTIFETRPCLTLRPSATGGQYKALAGHQAGGRLAELGSGELLLTVGDFEFDGVTRSPAFPQNLDADYGKTFLLDIKGGTRKLLTIGHRNPQGLLIEDNGRILSTEHGPRGGDELNVIQAGQNYGWPLVTLGTDYFHDDWPLAKNVGQHEGFESPLYAWVPSIAVSNLIEVKNFAPEWDGDILVASLHGQLRRLRMSQDRVLYDEPIAVDERIRDIDQIADGRIVLLTDTAKIITLQPRRPRRG
jgi:glucose/arabinose dehydrogenase